MTENHPNQAPTAAAPRLISPVAIAFLLAVFTFALYLPAMRCDFVNYDDPDYYYGNPHVLGGFTPDNLHWAFTTGFMGNWNPLIWLSLMLDATLFGPGPAGPHFTNILLHTLDSALLFWLLWRLTAARWRSALVAALFAWHPLHVESVAWIAERKDVLSALFGLLALLFYARHAQAARDPGKPDSRDYWLAVLCLALGLMSKPMLVTWPFVMLLIDYWPLNRWNPAKLKPLLVEKNPFFALAFATCVATLFAQQHVGAMTNSFVLPFGARAENAVIACCRYWGKLFYPVNLAVYYPPHRYWPVEQVVPAALALAGVSALVIARRRPRPWLLTGWLWFLITLLPVIGLVQVGAQAIADRYLYLPSVGAFIMVVWGGADLARAGRWLKTALTLAAVAALSGCLATTGRQLGYWRDSEHLFRHALEVTEKNPLTLNNLGTALLAEGRTEESLALFQQTVQLDPNYAKGHANLGATLTALGRPAEAVTEYEIALALDPDSTFARTNLAALLAASDQTSPATAALEASVHNHPDDPAAHENLARAFQQSGRTYDAIVEFQQVIRLQPGNVRVRFDLGNLLARTGRTDDAISQLQEVVRLQPSNADAHNNLGAVLNRAYRTDEAAAQFQEVLRLQPDNAEAHYNFAGIVFKTGKMDEAIQQYREVIRLKPEYAPAHYYLGLALAKTGRTADAVSELQEALRLKPDYAAAQTSLEKLQAAKLAQ